MPYDETAPLRLQLPLRLYSATLAPEHPAAGGLEGVVTHEIVDGNNIFLASLDGEVETGWEPRIAELLTAAPWLMQILTHIPFGALAQVPEELMERYRALQLDFKMKWPAPNAPQSH